MAQIFNFAVLRNSTGPLFVRGVGLCTSFLLSVALARVLGLTNFGLYSLAVSLVMVLAIPVQGGIPALVVRETAKADRANTPDVTGALCRWSRRLILLYSAVVFSLSALYLAVATPAGDDFRTAYLFAVLSLPFSALMLRNSALLRGFHRFVAGTLPEVLARPLTQLALFAAVWAFSDGHARNPSVALAVYTISFAIALGISLLFLRPLRGRFGSASSEKPSASWRQALILLTINGGGQVLFGHVDTLMLGMLMRPEDVGSYRAALQVSMLLIFVLTVVNQVIQPRLATLYHEGSTAELQDLVASSSLTIFCATAVPGIVIILLAGPILELLFGADYQVASRTLQILVLGQCLNVFFGSVGTILNMTGHEGKAVRGMVMAIAVNLVLDILLIPPLGTEGAALASAISIVLWNLILRHYTKKHVGIESSGILHRLKTLIS